jgi:S-DNA-T family DNA segregation ATPase FtsK/SpoIIIE
VIGAVLVLCVLYALGLGLLTGVSSRSAAAAVLRGAEALRARLRNGPEGRSGRVATKRTRGALAADRVAKRRGEEGVGEPDEGGSATEELEVVLPVRREDAPFAGQSEAIPGEYVAPSASLLNRGRADPEHDAEETSRRLARALLDLGVEAQVVRAVVGPRVTRYELRLGSGVKVGKVRNLQQDIAYALAATEVRILAPIPGKSAVGVEVPNTRPAKVTLGDVFQEYPEGNDWALPVGLGKDISGRAVFFDLADMPHLLVAGTTGSGKSVMLNSLLTSLLLTTDPSQVKMVLVDPKRVELAHFGRIPHLITPVVTDVKKAS